MRSLSNVIASFSEPPIELLTAEPSTSSPVVTRDRRSSISAAISVIKSAASSLTAPSYERASIVEGRAIKKGHVISTTGWQVVWPGLNVLELTRTGVRLLTEDQSKVKIDMHVSAMEEVGVNPKNPVQFFIRGRSPDGTTIWSLEGPTNIETAEWVEAIREVMRSQISNIDELQPTQTRSRSTTAPPSYIGGMPNAVPPARSTTRSSYVAPPREPPSIIVVEESSVPQITSRDEDDDDGSESEDLLVEPEVSDSFRMPPPARARAHTFSPGMRETVRVEPRVEEWDPFTNMPNLASTYTVASTPAQRQHNLDLL